jgi:predicted TPR repeat methyltransferase
MSNAIINNEKVSHVDNIFVREIFDAFADDFEDVLHNLDYKVPTLISKSLDSLFSNLKLKKMKILDVGCGTGLCGKYLKKYSKFRGLDGVDISPKMLKIAKQKKLYTHLYNRDLRKFLDSHTSSYDLIVAADVFTYFGELNPLFILLYNSLRKGGRILFSISENNFNNNNYFLHQSGRFLHNRKYVENSLNRQGFFIEKLNRACLRNEGDKKVYGWIVMAQKQ